MSSTRSINWSVAMHALSADRAKPVPGLVSARALIEHTAARTRPLVVAGAYDRAAIMAAAVFAAKAHQARTGATWGEVMSVALKASWSLAKRTRSAKAH